MIFSFFFLLFVENVFVFAIIQKYSSSSSVKRPVEIIDARSSVWPLPQYVYLSPDPQSYYLESSNFSFEFGDNRSNDILDRAILRYRSYIFRYFSSSSTINNNNINNNNTNLLLNSSSKKKKNDNNNNNFNISSLQLLSKIVINVANVADMNLQLGVDESYSLTIDNVDGEGIVAHLDSQTTWGALHGLETFAQSIWYDFTNELYLLPFGPYQFIDHPRFSHRGLLIDTSRHFIPVDVILHIIDGLEASKMNVLHWHIVDANSFPARVESWPGLTDLGAFSSSEIYSIEDMKYIVSYAKDRGVRILPEFDVPGHTASWLGGHPDFNIVTCLNRNREDGYCANNPCGQLDATDDRTYDVLDGLFKELTEIFTDNHVHYGYDEIVAGCWEDEPHIAEWMADRNMTSLDLLQYFTDHLMATNAATGKTPVFWEEVYLDNLIVPTDTIIQIWINFDVMNDALLDNRKVVLSNYQNVYLDCMGVGYDTNIVGPRPPGHTWCTWNSWEEIYANEPFPSSSPVPPELRVNLLGGETASWAEKTDEVNSMPKEFPRTSAFGERMWSNPDHITDMEAAKFRILRHRCHLRRRGVEAEPLEPGSNSDLCYFMII